MWVRLGETEADRLGPDPFSSREVRERRASAADCEEHDGFVDRSSDRDMKPVVHPTHLILAEVTTFFSRSCWDFKSVSRIWPAHVGRYESWPKKWNVRRGSIACSIRRLLSASSPITPMATP